MNPVMNPVLSLDELKSNICKGNLCRHVTYAHTIQYIHTSMCDKCRKC